MKVSNYLRLHDISSCYNPDMESAFTIDAVTIKVVSVLDPVQQIQVAELQKIAFATVDAQEAQEDFYHRESCHVLAYLKHQLVGWCGVHETTQTYQGKEIKLGGYGICTHPEWRGQGIASRVSKVAKDGLFKRGGEVAFLSVDPTNQASVKLHHKNGFVMLHRDFSWINSQGELKQDRGAMIAPLNSQDLFEHILHGIDVLHLGNGYW